MTLSRVLSGPDGDVGEGCLRRPSLPDPRTQTIEVVDYQWVGCGHDTLDRGRGREPVSHPSLHSKDRQAPHSVAVRPTREVALGG